MTIEHLIKTLEYKRDCITAAITNLRDMSGNWVEIPSLNLSTEPEMRFTQEPAPAVEPKAERPAKATSAAKPPKPAIASDRAIEAVLSHLLAAKTPTPSSQVARAIGRNQSNTGNALRTLEQRGLAARTGNGATTRWAAVKSPTTTAPRNGKNAVDGVEFETVFSGAKGQSLIGDQPSKGARL